MDRLLKGFVVNNPRWAAFSQNDYGSQRDEELDDKEFDDDTAAI